MTAKRFTHLDEAFICRHCGFAVPPLRVTSRNHCPKCLHSLHVDDNPGDRNNPCRGLMRPIGVESDAKKGYVIVFQCRACGEVKRNKSAPDDDFDRLVRLAASGDARF